MTRKRSGLGRAQPRTNTGPVVSAEATGQLHPAARRDAPTAPALVSVLRLKRSTLVVVDLGAIDARLTADGAVELFGHVRHHFAAWRTRASAGEVAPPWSWSALLCDLIGHRLEVLVLPDEADHVAAVLEEILGRPGMTEPDPPPPPRRPRRTTKATRR